MIIDKEQRIVVGFFMIERFSVFYGTNVYIHLFFIT